MEWDRFASSPCVNASCVCACVQSFVKMDYCAQKKKNVVRCYLAFYLGDPMNKAPSMCREERCRGRSLFKCVFVCAAAAAAFQNKMCAIRFSVQEHLVFYGNRVNRKLNIFFLEASCISIVV